MTTSSFPLPPPSTARSRTVLIWLALFYFAVGVAMAFVQTLPRAQDFITCLPAIPTVAAIYLWCKREAVERGTLAPGKGPLWAAVFPPLMLPVYFLRTRRFPGAIMAMAKALVFYVCLLVIFLAGVVGAAFAFSFVQVR